MVAAGATVKPRRPKEDFKVISTTTTEAVSLVTDTLGLRTVVVTTLTFPEVNPAPQEVLPEVEVATGAPEGTPIRQRGTCTTDLASMALLT